MKVVAFSNSVFLLNDILLVMPTGWRWASFNNAQARLTPVSRFDTKHHLSNQSITWIPAWFKVSLSYYAYIMDAIGFIFFYHKELWTCYTIRALLTTDSMTLSLQRKKLLLGPRVKFSQCKWQPKHEKLNMFPKILLQVRNFITIQIELGHHCAFDKYLQ